MCLSKQGRDKVEGVLPIAKKGGGAFNAAELLVSALAMGWARFLHACVH